MSCELCKKPLKDEYGTYVCDECGLEVCRNCCNYDEEADYVICDDCQGETSDELEEDAAE